MMAITSLAASRTEASEDSTGGTTVLLFATVFGNPCQANRFPVRRVAEERLFHVGLVFKYPRVKGERANVDEGKSMESADVKNPTFSQRAR